MTTTNNKKQKYHDHYQQPLVAEEKEQKILNKARKEHNNVKTSVNMKKCHLEKQRDQNQKIPSQSKPPLASHIEYPEQNDILFGRGWDVSVLVFAFGFFLHDIRGLLFYLSSEVNTPFPSFF